MAKFNFILTLIFTSFLFLDLVILSIAVRNNLKVENKYYKFHKKYGVKRTSILKSILGISVIIGLLDPPVNIVKLYWILILYFVYLIWVFILIISAPADKETESLEINKNPLDGFVGFLVYPFEYLDTKKQFYPEQPEKLKWSWVAFFVPEYWYFSNEILGAGYISWTFLIIYFVLSFYFGIKIFFAIVLIRIISGAFGQKLYYARYGKWA